MIMIIGSVMMDMSSVARVVAWFSVSCIMLFVRMFVGMFFVRECFLKVCWLLF